MRSIITLTAISIFFSTCVKSQTTKEIETFVLLQKSKYPKIHLVDIYKSCYQDFMGAEHLVSDEESVKKYIVSELHGMDQDCAAEFDFEPCGINGEYIRVGLTQIKNKTLEIDSLSNWFMESVQTAKKRTLAQWIKKWRKIENVICNMKLDLPDYEREKLFIESLFEKGQYACSHSKEFGETYHPHYRIVSVRVLKRHNVSY